MKILLLSICGKLNEPEETRFINLYLASLKKHVVPFFDTKVILLTTYKIEDMSSSLLKKRIDEFGLSNVVVLKTIDDMELPEKSLNYIKTIDWFNRIGIHMNVLFDYAKKYNFFDADWTFHVDTDSEFFVDFSNCINSIQELRKIYPRIIVTLAGDAYPPYVVQTPYEYIFDSPARVNFYENDGANYHSNAIEVIKKELRQEDHRRKFDHAVFCPPQMKVRNDFVGLSREACEYSNYNWVFMNYNYNFKDKGPIQDLWPDKAIKIDTNGNETEIKMPQIHLNYHMGGMLLYKLVSNEINIIKVQLPGYSHAVCHYGSGWFSGIFIERAVEALHAKFSDTKEIWEKDYLL